jgi:hypothetical protein
MLDRSLPTSLYRLKLLPKATRATRRVFAVQTKARIEPIKSLRSLDLRYDEWRETPFPLCLFFFTMKNDQAFYSWITEPIIANDNRPKLHLNTEGNLIELDSRALDSIVDQVNRWYDALFRELAA